MTTTATEARTLPRTRLVSNITEGLAEGDEYPYLIVTLGAPVGYTGCLILPSDHPAGWSITATQHPALQPYLGLKGWWVNGTQVATSGGEMAVPSAVVPDRLEGVPVEHRGDVPENARWVTTTAVIDDLPAGERFLAIPHETDGPILLAWPGHPRFGMFGARPNTPSGWHGWYSGNEVEYDSEPEVEERPIGVGDRVRVTVDHDRPTAVGQLATVIEMGHGGTHSVKVRYDSGDPGGTYGWWVGGVERITEEEEDPVVDTSAFVPGHWYTWDALSRWFRIERVEDDIVFRDAYCYPEQERIVESHGRRSISEITEREGFRIVDPATDETFAFTAPRAPYHVGQRVEVHDWPTEEWNGPATVVRVMGDVVTVERDAPSGRTGGFATAHIRPLVETFNPGDRVFLSSAHVLTPGGQVYHESPDGIGSVATVVETVAHNGNVRVRWEGSSRVSVAHPSCLSHARAEVAEPTVTPGLEGEETLRRQLTELQARYDDDLLAIAQIMRDEANERDWCSEYEEVVERINRRIHGTFAGERMNTFRVNYSGTVAVPFNGIVDVELPNGASRDDVIDAARQALTREVLQQSVLDTSGAQYQNESPEDVSIDDFNLHRRG